MWMRVLKFCLGLLELLWTHPMWMRVLKFFVSLFSVFFFDAFYADASVEISRSVNSVKMWLRDVFHVDVSVEIVMSANIDCKFDTSYTGASVEIMIIRSSEDIVFGAFYVCASVEIGLSETSDIEPRQVYPTLVRVLKFRTGLKNEVLCIWRILCGCGC